MGIGYQRRDLEVVDYQLYPLKFPEKDRVFVARGPQPKQLVKDHYFTCVGAAFTFGCYCEKPYGTLLQDKLGLPTLNLGFAGAGPYFFIKNQEFFIDLINQSRFAVILIMSGRSESNSVFDSGGLEMLTRISDGKKIGAEPAYRELLDSFDQSKVKKIICETRNNWVNNYCDLLKKITVPKILFWLSVRTPDYIESYENVRALFGEFPQLVNRDMIDKIRGDADEYVECISTRGMPQLLISRFTGKPVSVQARQDLGGHTRQHNSYYASPEMHEDAANVLEAVCREFV